MRLLFPLLLLLLVSCSSTSNGDNTRKYYLLEASVEAKTSSIEGTPIMSIRRVRLPDYISNNKGIVRRNGKGKIRISTLNTWAEHLDTRLPDVLAMELSLKLQNPVDLHPIPPGFNIPYILEVDIVDMIGGVNEDEKYTFDIQAKYRIIGTDKLKSYRFNTTFTIKDDSADSLAKSYSKALQALATDIAKHVK